MPSVGLGAGLELGGARAGGGVRAGRGRETKEMEMTEGRLDQEMKANCDFMG